MPFSTSYTFQAVDKYSAVLNKMARATKAHANSIKMLNRLIGTNATKTKQLNSAIRSVGSSTSASNQRMRLFAARLRATTSAANAQSKALRGLASAQSKLHSGAGSSGMKWPGQNLPGGGGGKPGSRHHKFLRSQGGIQNLSSAGLAATAAGAAATAPMVMSVKAAGSYEQAFAQVRKVMGDTASPKELDKVKADLLAMTKTYALSAESLTEIASTAGQAGISLKELAGFTDLAAAASIAFGMSTDEVSDDQVKIKNSFKLTNAGLREVINQINFLENTSVASGRDILTVLNEMGGSASDLMKAGDVAAFAATIISAGTNANRADRALREMFNTLRDIKHQSKPARAAFEGLMGPLDKFDKAMKKDALKATLDFFTKLKSKGKEAVGISNQIFGTGFGGDVKRLADNKDMLQQYIEQLRRGAAKDSLMKEVIAKQQTFNSQVQLLGNTFNRIWIKIGDTMLPILTKVVLKINDIMLAVETWVDTNPDLAMWATVLATVAGVALLVVGGMLLLAGALAPVVQLAMTFMALECAGAILATAAAVATTVGWVIAIGAAFLVAYNYCEPFRNLMNALGHLVMSVLTVAFNGLMESIKSIIGTFVWLTKVVMDFIAKTPALQHFFEGLGNIVNQVAGQINGLASALDSLSGKSVEVSATTGSQVGVHINVNAPKGAVKSVTSTAKGAKVTTRRTGTQMRT